MKVSDFAHHRERDNIVDLAPSKRDGEYFIRLLFVSWRKGFRLLEVPVFYVLRRHGTSKSQFFKMLRDYTRCVLSLRLRQWVQVAQATGLLSCSFNMAGG